MRTIVATIAATLAIVGVMSVTAVTGSSHREQPRILLDPASDYEAYYEPGATSPFVQ
jgi:hypothetical protein